MDDGISSRHKKWIRDEMREIQRRTKLPPPPQLASRLLLRCSVVFPPFSPRAGARNPLCPLLPSPLPYRATKFPTNLTPFVRSFAPPPIMCSKTVPYVPRSGPRS